MNWWNEKRPKIATGLLCWEDSMIVLPTIDLAPLDGSDGKTWSIRIMEGGRGRWYYTQVSDAGLALFLTAWRLDPERTFEETFASKPPKGLGEHGGRVTGEVRKKSGEPAIEVEFDL